MICVLVVKYHIVNHHISATTYHELLLQFTFCFFQVVKLHLFWLWDNIKQDNNNCIIQHEYFIITQHEYFIIKPCQQQRSLSILLFGVVRYKYCILVQCQEQCWLFDVAEVKKKASTCLCIVYENTLLKYESQHCS